MGQKHSFVASLTMVSVCCVFSTSVAATASFETSEYLRQEGLHLINASEAYSLGYTGLGVTVGVVDSGINALHPEFIGKTAGGYDFVFNRPDVPGQGIDLDGHGSHVNGIIGARRDGSGMHGVAFDAQLFTVRAYDQDDDDDDEDDDGDGDDNDMGNPDIVLARPWNYLLSQEVSIVNNSLGINDCAEVYAPPCNVTDYTAATGQQLHPGVVEVFHKLAAADKLMVFATGNENQDHSDFLGGAPHLFAGLKDNWMAVTAVSVDGTTAHYSNRCGVAKDWCLTAPGGGDDELEMGVYSVDTDGDYVRFSGTSMASPHVAGAAALVKQAFPYFDAYHLQQTLLTTATDIGPAGVDDIYGWGLLNAGKAVRGPAQLTSSFDVDTQGYKSTFSNNINGSGVLVKRGAGMLRLTGANTYTGSTRVAGGELVVDGSQVSAVLVDRAGTLSGSGSVGGVDLYGTVAPGNSVGTLTVNGNYVSHSGSVYEAEVDASGNSDRIVVNGTVQLNGGSLNLQGGPFRQSANYQLITATDGVQGQLDAVNSKLVFLTPELAYNPSEMSMAVVRNNVRLSSFVFTPNQKAVADGLDQTPSAPTPGLTAFYDEVLNGTGAGLSGITDQLSGEVHASTQSALLNSSSVVVRTLSDRARDNLGAQRAIASSPDYPLWAQVVGNWNTLSGDGNAAEARTHKRGIFIGGDAALGSGWRAGGALGFTDGRVKVSERASRADTSSYTAALYASNTWSAKLGQVNLLGGAAYTRHNIDSQRNVSAGGMQTLKADYHANSVQLFTELGYAIPTGAISMVEPYLGLAWINQRSKSFSESGGIMALHGKSENDDITTFTLGLRGKANLEWGANNRATLSGGLGWRHAAGDVNPTRRMTFVEGGNAFKVAGAPVAKNSAVLELGVEVALGKSTAMGLNYSGQFSSGNTDNAGSIYLKIRY